MLPDFRFAIGALLAVAVLGVASVGLLTAARLTGQVKVGPLQASRNVAFADRPDWNQFYHPDSARRFDELVRRHEQTAAEPAGGVVAMSEEADVSGLQVGETPAEAVTQPDSAVSEMPTGPLVAQPDATNDALVVMEPPVAAAPEEPVATPPLAAHDPTPDVERPAAPPEERATGQPSAGLAEHRRIDEVPPQSPTSVVADTGSAPPVDDAAAGVALAPPPAAEGR